MPSLTFIIKAATIRAEMPAVHRRERLKPSNFLDSKFRESSNYAKRSYSPYLRTTRLIRWHQGR